jgi:hypothetical protein
VASVSSNSVSQVVQRTIVVVESAMPMRDRRCIQTPQTTGV